MNGFLFAMGVIPDQYGTSITVGFERDAYLTQITGFELLQRLHAIFYSFLLFPGSGGAPHPSARLRGGAPRGRPSWLGWPHRVDGAGADLPRARVQDRGD